MKRLIIAFIGLVLMVGIARADTITIDCSGLPSSHNVDVTVKTKAGVAVVTLQNTTEVVNTSDSNYYYDLTGTAGTPYSVECVDVTDATNNFSFTVSSWETYVNASVSSRSDGTGVTLHADYNAAKTAATQTSVNAIPTNPTLQTMWTDAKAGYLTGNVALDSTVAKDLTVAKEATLSTVSGKIDTAQADLDNPSQYKADVSSLALQASVDDLESRLTATRAGYIDNLSGGAVALNSTLTNATYGLSALQVLLDAISTSTELTAMFDAIKGAGWTTETLKAIKDAVTTGTITSQVVRDAMKLAPTAGDPATGSIDKQIDNIESTIKHQ